jgi:hypothetical protein
MCVGVIKNELMCRINPDLHGACIKKKGCRTMDFTNRPMIGYIMVDDRGMKSQKDLYYWLDHAIDFNKQAKSSKKKKKM